MKKQLRSGKICVIYSPNWGAGWYSWHGVEELLFDPTLVEMIERGATHDEMEEYCITAYGMDGQYLGIQDGLEVAYVDPGDRFYIHEYDGAESIVLESTFNWINAS